MLMRRAITLLACLFAAASVPLVAQHDGHGTALDSSAMQKARHELEHHHGGERFLFLEAERLEFQSGDAEDLFVLESQGWYGGDEDRLWWKLEAEESDGGAGEEELEVQALWSRALSPYFDLQMGVRQDLGTGEDRTHATIGVQGLAPYWFEIDAAAFLSTDGDLSARLETEYELLFTQRLVLEPRLEVSFAASDVPEVGIASGLTDMELGARLRYEIRRQFAPYVGVEWAKILGGTADLAEAASEETEATRWVTGVRLWF